MKHFLLAGALAIAALGTANADETWRTADGLEIVYETDIEGTGMAVLSFDGVTLYVDGLTGVFQDRGTFSGVWFSDEDSATAVPDAGCGVAMVRPGTQDEASTYWGQLEITFIDPDFPSIWLGRFGECFGPLENQMIARPDIVAE